jgi:VIT1/CCC1 family predicted Fe2+/Mn2+ transporter
METSRTLVLTVVAISLALTLIGSGAAIARRSDGPFLTRIVAVAAWLVGAHLLVRIAHLWSLA